MDDGTVLRADVFLPEKEGTWPVIITALTRCRLAPNATAEGAMGLQEFFSPFRM
jgi:predicted acyl esterase